MSPPITIRPELADDAPQVRRVNELAFGQPLEANIVDAVRAAGAATLSLVAVRDHEIVGHILFSPVTITGPDGEHTAIGLAPMAVLPSAQNDGIGSRLVRAGLDQLRAAGHAVVVVLGHPAYYPRFGFVRASIHGLRYGHDVPDEAFMVTSLVPGHPIPAGTVRYRPEIDGV